MTAGGEGPSELKALGWGFARGFEAHSIVILSGARKRAVEGSRSMAWEVIWLEELKNNSWIWKLSNYNV